MIGTRITGSASPKSDFFDIFTPSPNCFPTGAWRLALVLQPAQAALGAQLSEDVKMPKNSLFGLADPEILVPIIIIHHIKHPGAL